MAYCANTSIPQSGHATLDQFISRLLVLQAQGAGHLQVLIETRNRSGAVIYAKANARRDTVVRVEGGYRNCHAGGQHTVAVVRIG